MKSGAHPTGTEVTRECFTNWFWAGHGFTGCGKSPVSYQGIALAILEALQNQTPL